MGKQQIVTNKDHLTNFVELLEVPFQAENFKSEAYKDLNL